MTELRIGAPNEKQRRFLLDRHRHIAYGGARGGGKSWAVRTKAKLLALRYAGIKLLIVRRTLRELQNNHIDPLRQELTGQLAAELLLGESAALYEDLYTRGLIDADFSSGFTRVPSAAFLQAGGAGCDPEAVLEAILQAPKTSFSPERFARLKKSVRGRLLRELDGFESTCYRICEAIFAGGDCFCEFDLLDSITLSDTEALLTQTVTPERAALSVAAPEEA